MAKVISPWTITTAVQTQRLLLMVPVFLPTESAERLVLSVLAVLGRLGFTGRLARPVSPKRLAAVYPVRHWHLQPDLVPQLSLLHKIRLRPDFMPRQRVGTPVQRSPLSRWKLWLLMPPMAPMPMRITVITRQPLL